MASRAALLRRRTLPLRAAVAALCAAAVVGPAAEAQQVPADLAFHRDGAVWVSRADGRAARVFYRTARASVVPYPITWLPDGSLLVMEVGRDCTATRRVEPSGRPTPFPKPRQEGCPQDVALTPDGRYVAYSSYAPSFACRVDRRNTCAALAFRHIEAESADAFRPAGVTDPLWFIRFAPDGVTLYAVRKPFEAEVERPGRLVSIDMLTARARTVSSNVDAIDVDRQGNIAIQRLRRILVRTPAGLERDVGAGESPAFSADGRSIYVVRRNQIWQIPLETGNARRIVRNAGTPVPRRTYDSISPQRPPGGLAYLRDGNVFVGDRQGERRLTDSGGYTSIGWLPDGAHLLGLRDGTPVVVPLQASDEDPIRPFPLGRPDISVLATSPASGLVAFVTPDDNGLESVYLRRLAGGALRRITAARPNDDPGGDPNFGGLAFSPAGDRLLVTHGQHSDSRRLVVFDARTGEELEAPSERVEGHGAVTLAGELVWTGGTFVEGAFQTRIALHAGTRILAPSLDDAFHPSVSPDGRWIAFTRMPGSPLGAGRRRTESDVWVVEPDGSNVRLVAQDAYMPVWRPLAPAQPAGGGFPVVPLAGGVLVAAAGGFLVRRLRPRGGYRRAVLRRDKPIVGDTSAAGVALCAFCGSMIGKDEPFCPRCGMHADDCGCVYAYGKRRITCWEHFRATP